MFSRKATLGIILALQLTACASSSQVPSADWRNGAKHAQIVQFYTFDVPSTELPECLASVSETERATNHFVKVQYRHARRMFYAVAELPESMPAKIDDKVELWPEDCSRGKISRISRILPFNS